MEEIGSYGWGQDDEEGGEGKGLKIWPSRQGIRFAIGGTFPVGDRVMVGSEGGRPPIVSPGCSPGSREVFLVFMVRVDLDRVCRSL